MKVRQGPLPAARADRDFDRFNIIDHLAHTSAVSRPALIAGEARIEYRELWDLVERASRLLIEQGALDGKGAVARVGLAFPNGVAHIALALAILRAGGCVIPIPSELAPAERIALARAVRLDVALLAPGVEWPEAGERSRLAVPELEATLVRGLSSGADSADFGEADFADLEPAFVRFSSGTTGTSKGVVLSHRTLLERLGSVNQGLRIGEDDRVVWFLPMAHHFVSSILLFLASGATIVLARSHLGKEMLGAAQQHRATVLYGTPYQYSLLAAEPSGAAAHSIRLAVSTAATLPAETAAGFLQRFGLPLTQALGIIEIGLPIMNLERAREKPCALGRPLPGFTVELRDEHGRPVATGELGEIQLRGPGMLDAYLSPWRRRDEIAPQGWFSAGDLAWQDEDGDLWLAGRSRTVVNVAGLKCFPEEIEAVLVTHPGVRAARVRPKPHSRIGAVPVAEVIAREPDAPPSEASLAAHCRARLARYKVPVEFHVVRELETTPSGKLRRV